MALKVSKDIFQIRTDHIMDTLMITLSMVRLIRSKTMICSTYEGSDMKFWVAYWDPSWSSYWVLWGVVILLLTLVLQSNKNLVLWHTANLLHIYINFHSYII